MTEKEEHGISNPSTSASADKATGKRNRSKTLDDVQNNTTSNKHRRRPKKKSRPSNVPTLDDSAHDTKPTDPLTFLPLELLREILVGTRSTRDVLAVARCNKHLWKTLTGPPADFIWKGTRQVAVPQPLPDPPSQLSETAYAAMVFDGGLCEICEKYTKESYFLFALKFRICKKDKCREMKPERNFFKLLSGEQEPIMKRTPTIEVDNSVFNKYFNSGTKKYWPKAEKWCRTREWLKSVRDSNAGEAEVQENEELKRKHQEAFKKNKEWMEFCVALRKWKETYDTKLLANKRSNEKFAKDIARANKLNSHDLKERTTFGALHIIRDKCLEPLTTNDFDALTATVNEEIDALSRKRKVSQRDASYRTVWEAVQAYCHQLRSGGSKVVLPPFSTFRRLPTLASLLTIANSDTSKSIQDILQQNGLRDVMRIELGKWESDARRNMAALLGYPDWTSGSESDADEWQKVVHPVDLATARFLCKACTERAREHEWEIESLTFVKACSHECPQGKKERFAMWDASIFVKDDKAVAAVKRALEVCELDEASTLWETVGKRRIKCTSCKPFSFMTFNDLVVHCHRHEDMEIASGNDEEMEATLKPLMEYLSKAGKDHSYKLKKRGEKERDVKDCGCKHCLFAEALKFPNKDAQTLLKDMHKMTINGLRSHLKAKHGYPLLSDEDVFTYSPEGEACANPGVSGSPSPVSVKTPTRNRGYGLSVPTGRGTPEV